MGCGRLFPSPRKPKQICACSPLSRSLTSLNTVLTTYEFCPLLQCVTAAWSCWTHRTSVAGPSAQCGSTPTCLTAFTAPSPLRWSLLPQHEVSAPALAPAGCACDSTRTCCLFNASNRRPACTIHFVFSFPGLCPNEPCIIVIDLKLPAHYCDNFDVYICYEYVYDVFLRFRRMHL